MVSVRVAPGVTAHLGGRGQEAQCRLGELGLFVDVADVVNAGGVAGCTKCVQEWWRWARSGRFQDLEPQMEVKAVSVPWTATVIDALCRY